MATEVKHPGDKGEVPMHTYMLSMYIYMDIYIYMVRPSPGAYVSLHFDHLLQDFCICWPNMGTKEGVP